jgi:hypothetical protein
MNTNGEDKPRRWKCVFTRADGSQWEHEHTHEIPAPMAEDYGHIIAGRRIVNVYGLRYTKDIDDTLSVAYYEWITTRESRMPGSA